MKRKITSVLLAVVLVLTLGGSAALALPGTWQLNPDANAEVSVVGDTITLGVAGDLEGDSQPMAVHGASIELPPAEEIYVEFNYNLSTWDSYNAPGTPNPPWWGGTGYFDSFSISVSQNQYWTLGLSDPLNGDPLSLGFLWGGTSYADGNLETTSGSGFATMSASTASNNYLNVVLDTATPLANNGNYPSWGTIEITKVEILGVPEVTKELVVASWVSGGDDDGILDLGEKWNFTLEITVTNNTFMPIDNVIVKDNFGGDLELFSTDVANDGYGVDNTWPIPASKKKKNNALTDDSGKITVEWSGKTKKVHMWWDVGTLAAGQSATLTVVVSTDQNPAGKQQYTSSGTHCLNSGATSKGSITVDSAVWPVSDTTEEICVEIGQAPHIGNNG